MSQVRHKVFISYHHGNESEVQDFIKTYDEERDVFITRSLGTDIEQDVINSDDTGYVMQRIRDLYLRDSTVTIILIGKCSWARRYVDWETQSSLRHGQTVTANGLLGILLPSMGDTATAPERLRSNLTLEDGSNGYARWYVYPQRKDTLAGWIEDAFNARTSRADLIVNARDRFKNNRQC